MKKYSTINISICLIALFQFGMLSFSCNKDSFLNKKPKADIVVANTFADFNNLLENTSILRSTGGLAQMSSDDYFIPTSAEWSGLSSQTQRNAYIWAGDIYGGEGNIRDWNSLYTSVLYANAVLEGLSSMAESETEIGRNLRGRALFVRAYAFYDLVRNFCKAYQPSTSKTDLGIPLKLVAAVEQLEQRSTLEESYSRILQDLAFAEPLLSSVRPSNNLNRPWKGAVYALLARIYLDMGDYPRAEVYADKLLDIYDTLLDYNTVNRSSANPFSTTNVELIYNTTQVVAYSALTGSGASSVARISPNLISLYKADDLRLPIFFTYNATTANYTKKNGYYGIGLYPFTGLATDEIHLVKAECLARRDRAAEAMDRLNLLRIKRFPAASYVPLTANSSVEALSLVMSERRRELVWRGLRWHDLKRLNRDNAGINLQRTIDGKTYTLMANDPRWVFPIPDDEIALSGIAQNIR